MTFTTDQVTNGTSSCSNTRAFGPDNLSIFHLKHLGSRGIEYLTALFNDSVTSCRFGSHPLSSQSRNQARLLSQHFSSAYLAPLSSSESYGGSLTSNRKQPPASSSRPTRLPTRILYHFCFATSDIATGFNQRKPPHRTVCVADGGIRYSQPQRIVINDCKINPAGGDLSISVKICQTT